MSSEYDSKDPQAGNYPETHSEDLDVTRRSALDEIDNAKFSRYHVKACAVAGVGFFTDAYDIFSISICATMIGIVEHNGGANTANQDLGIKVAHSVGTLCGQLGFGYLADRIGRKKMYGLELIVIIIGTLGQTLSGKSSAISLYTALIIWRFFMGVGIGGDYPLSAVITSEFAPKAIRGRMATSVFACQGWGNLTSGIVALITIVAFHKHIVTDAATYEISVDRMWRIIIGFGCIPGAAALYFRLTIPETPRYTMDVERDVKLASKNASSYLATGSFNTEQEGVIVKADLPKASWADFRRHFGQWKNGKVLFGAAWSWFALDVAFYGLGLNSSTILTTIGFGAPSTGYKGTAQQKIYDTLHNVAIGNIILAVGGLIPGYWATFFLIDKVGRKPIQLMGFTILTIIFVVMGFGYHKLQSTAAGKKGFVVLYCLANFFQNFGPNTTTFIIPGEVFPTRYRSTAHGISAASGKLGAIVAQVGFARMIDIGGATGKHAFLPHILEIFAFFMLTGIFSTLLLPETMGLSLEELSNESQDNFAHSGADQYDDRNERLEREKAL